MKKIITVFLIAFLINATALAARGIRGFDRKLERAEELYHGGSFYNALTAYLELYKADSSNCNISYRLGDCYLKTGGSPKKALYYLKKASQSVSSNYMEGSGKEKGAPVTVYKLLGDAHHLNSEFDIAIANYEKYKRALSSARNHEIAIVKEINRKIEMCNNAKELVAHPAEVKIINLGKNINSVYPDYSPRLSADQNTMIYTSRRPGNVGGNTYDEGQYFEDIYISTKKGNEWSPAANIGEPVNTVGNEAAIAFAADGQEILIYKDDMGDGNIYSTRLEGDKWTVPVKLNSNINSKFWEPAAFISADGNTLYFVSDRPGGYGGTDIYKSKKTASGDWGRAVNLGPTINTPYDEYTPFIHPDGVTLFFSSKGHNSMGGYDIFFSRTMPSDERIWLAPTNVGYPINTPGDDAFYTVSPDKQRAYYSSGRDGGFGEKDNYMVTFSDNIISPLALMKGAVLDTNNQAPRNMKITVTDNETGQVVGVYYPNSKSGKYTFILTPGKSHNIVYEADGALFYSENRYVSEETKFTETDKPVKLPTVAVGSKVVLNNVFFDFDKTELRPNSKAELERIYNFLLKSPAVSVEVSGYADSKGSDSYNKKLSQQRAQAVVNYLLSKGINKERMTAQGYGEVKSSALANSEKANPSGRESDRRVELKITDIKPN
jgi:outer membrane protein OmpA-like peptidoglycan-associated protein